MPGHNHADSDHNHASHSHAGHSHDNLGDDDGHSHGPAGANPYLLPGLSLVLLLAGLALDYFHAGFFAGLVRLLWYGVAFGLVGALETKSTHPIARAVVAHVGAAAAGVPVENVEEIAGHGLRGIVDGRPVLAGNAKLLSKFGIGYPAEVDEVADSIVVAALDGRYAGYLTVADAPKADAAQAVRALRAAGITRLVMLSGDKDSIVQRVAKELGINEAHGDLLPEDKARFVQQYLDEVRKVAFVGDGVNDAPVVALADVGIAMGGLGSDATIETADVVIRTDHPSKIATARRIARATHRVVWQNTWLAFAVKAVVLALGAGGLATMWEAVFADVGVALLAILNAVRIQHMSFTKE